MNTTIFGMKKYLFFLFLSSTIIHSCKNSGTLAVTQIEGSQITISDSIPVDPQIEDYIKPYREHINKEMDAVLAYAPLSLTKSEGELNTAIGNMMADAVMQLANPIFKKRTGKEIDIVLLNHGGIRSSLNRGNVTTRTAFQIMPFENEVVIAELTTGQVREMLRYLVDSGTAHPVTGLELVLDQNNSIQKILIQGKPIKENSTYFVATNDYLFQGGDNMVFFSDALSLTTIDYKIRNLLIDYFEREDTIAPVEDKRFIRIK